MVLFSDFKICSVNCRGLGSFEKQKDVFNSLRTKSYSIYMLQNTRFSKEKEPFVRSLWGGECIFNNNNNRYRGVAILFSYSFSYKVHKYYGDNSDNMLIIDIIIRHFPFTLVNLYGPNSDQPDFYSFIIDKIKRFGNAGYFNLILQQSLDSYNYQNVNYPRAREKVLQMLGELDLVVMWRDRNPDIKQFTWRRKHPLKQARLDLFLISHNLYPFVTDTNIISSYRTDHSLISLKFNLTNQQKCNTYWKFNNSLLGDKEYVRIVKEVIFNVVQQYAAKGYEPTD